MEATFLHHGSCPECGSRDNVAHYSDGHTYCFGCKAYSPPPNSLDRLKARLASAGPDSKSELELPRNVRPLKQWPDVAKEWIFKYGITPHEIQTYGITYDMDTTSIVLPLRDEEGNLVAYQHRMFWGNTKYLTRGHPKEATHFGTGSAVVFVEDILSAIKVARVAKAVPICGSVAPLTRMQEYVEAGDTVILWLDRDKLKESIQATRELQSWYMEPRPIFSVYTDLDPKEYSTDVIRRQIYGSEEWPTQRH